MKANFRFLAVLATLSLASLLGCGESRFNWRSFRFEQADSQTEQTLDSSWTDGAEFMVAADHAAASKAGAKILADGGNAVDAAVATSFALAVVRPESCGLGGGGFMLIHRPGKAPVVLDYRESAPAGARLDSYLDSQGRPIRGRTTRGAWSVGVPGTVRGLLHAFETYGSGRITRRQVLQPAIALAREGLPSNPHLFDAMQSLAGACERDAEVAKRFDTLCRTFLQDGEPIPLGDRVDRTGMVRTLRAIAEWGADGFYAGDIADRIVQSVAREDGPLTHQDLRSYQVRTLEPLKGEFDGFEILTMPPPSSGGAVILQILNTLAAAGDRLDAFYGEEGGVRYAHLLIESMKHAFADRAHFLGDRSPEVLADVERMILPDEAERIFSTIDLDAVGSSVGYGLQTLPDDAGTSHFCVVDRDGMAVACTESINLEFGSRIFVAGTGIILNNTMDDFAIDTTTPNAFGLRQSKRNLVRPGTRPLSSMSPTIVLKDGAVHMVAGASGGPRIISATIQTILHVLIGNMTVEKAIRAARLHHQWRPDRVDVQAHVPAEQLKDLFLRGHAIRRFPGSAGHVQAIHRLPDGRLRGACDPGKGGEPAGR